VGNPLPVPDPLFRRQDDGLARLQLHPASLHAADAYLGTAEIADDGEGFPRLRCRRTDVQAHPPMLFVRAVREVEARDVHSGLEKLLEPRDAGR